MDYGGRKTIERLQIRVPIVKNRLCQDMSNVDRCGLAERSPNSTPCDGQAAAGRCKAVTLLYLVLIVQESSQIVAPSPCFLILDNSQIQSFKTMGKTANIAFWGPDVAEIAVGSLFR